MSYAALYVLSGIALYGGIRQLYLGSVHASRHPHVLHGVLYFLLVALALNSVPLAGSGELSASTLAASKLFVALGILLWAVFVWFMLAYTRVRSYAALVVLTALWSLLLIANMASPQGLLYSPVAELSDAVATTGSVQVSLSRWWAIVELAALASLSWALYANLKFSRQDQTGASVALSAGLFVLMATVMLDFFISAGLIESASLTPFGFLAFLVASSLYPGETARAEQMHHTPVTVAGGTGVLPSVQIYDSAVDGDLAESRLGETPVRIEADQDDSLPAADAVHYITLPEPIRARLVDLSDQLTDVAVHATMVMNRFKKGETDPEVMQELCSKVSSEAMRSHRLANQLSRPDKRDW